MSRVVITGMGAMCALGNSLTELLDGLRAGRTGVRKVASIQDIERYPVQVGCEAPHFDLSAYGLADSWRDYDIITQRALATVAMSLEDAGLSTAALDEVGLSLATCMGGCTSREEFYRRGRTGLPAAHHLIRQVPCSAVTGHVARHFALGGPLSTTVTACAAGTAAIGLAIDQIRDERAEVMIAGGVDPFSAISFSGFSVLRAVSKTQAAPFTRGRAGLILGEGPAFLVLEDEARARRRGARIYGTLLGYGLSNDAYHSTSPDPAGGGAIRAMRCALEDAELQPAQIGYVNAHGTGTQHNDPMELEAMKQVFGEHLRKLAISSTKSQLGHTLAAAGAIELVATVLGMYHGFIPPTVGCDDPMWPDCDFVPVARAARFDFAMSNSFAFGGNTASVVVGRA